MASGKGADSTKSTDFKLLGVPSMSAVAEAGNPGNPQGPWKWLPEKERTLQNPQILGFCGVSFISAVPETGNPGNPQGPWKWLPEKERALQNRQLLAFVGVPSFRRSQRPEIQEIHRGLGNGCRKGPDSTKSTNFRLLWGSLHFSGPKKLEIQEIHRGVRNGFRKRSAQPSLQPSLQLSLQPPCRSAKGYFLFCSSLCSLFCSPPCSLQSSRTVWYFKSCRLQSLGFTVVVLQASRSFRGRAREEP